MPGREPLTAKEQEKGFKENVLDLYRWETVSTLEEKRSWNKEEVRREKNGERIKVSQPRTHTNNKG